MCCCAVAYLGDVTMKGVRERERERDAAASSSSAGMEMEIGLTPDGWMEGWKDGGREGKLSLSPTSLLLPKAGWPLYTAYTHIHTHRRALEVILSPSEDSKLQEQEWMDGWRLSFFLPFLHSWVSQSLSHPLSFSLSLSQHVVSSSSSEKMSSKWTHHHSSPVVSTLIIKQLNTVDSGQPKLVFINYRSLHPE